MKKFKKWFVEHKNDPAFKNTIIIIILIVLAIGAQIFDSVRTSLENKAALKALASLIIEK